jgi:hypothetical protein
MLGRRPTRRIVLRDTREPRPGSSHTHETCSGILWVTSSGATTYNSARGATSNAELTAHVGGAPSVVQSYLIERLVQLRLRLATMDRNSLRLAR